LELEEGSQIQDITIKNPYNEREFVGDKLTIVEVKAIDEKGEIYLIEIQLVIHAALVPRTLYTWSGIYHSQIQADDNYYHKLKPMISIWIMNDNLFDKVEDYHLDFSVSNRKHNLALKENVAFHLLQLPKWPSTFDVTNEKERWIYLFKEGKNVDTDNPPEP
jgi:predicted transposase/invertase (TIGR01784 family)